MKTVLLPIKVPEGKYCMKFIDEEGEECERLINDECQLDFASIMEPDGDYDGFFKHRECLELEEDNRDALLEV